MFLTFPHLGQINHLKLNFNNKLQNFLRVLDLNCKKKRRVEQFNFFDWLLNGTNLLVLNDSEHLQNLIEFY